MVNLLGSGKKLALQIGIALIFVVEGLALVSVILLRYIWGYVIVLGVIAFTLYFFYVRLHLKKTRYPLVPPEGKADIYFPRTDIPRPIHEDLRKMQKRKRRLEKIKKMARKKK